MSAREVRRDRIEPLWDRVDRSRIELAVFVVLFVGMIVLSVDIVMAVAIGAAFVLDPMLWGVRAGVFWPAIGWTSVAASLIGLVYAIVALLRSKQWIVKTLDATIVPKGELLETKYALKDMAIAAGRPVAPALHVIETSNVNAFVAGKPSERGVIGVTRGMVDRLPIEEQRAVFANLMARLKAGDTIWATGVSALMSPFWRADAAAMHASHQTLYGDTTSVGQDDSRPGESMTRWATGRALEVGIASGTGLLWFFAVAFALASAAEAIAFGHRRTQLRHAELADAEGMLLLKDPRSMLNALESAVRCNNFVPTAGPGFAQMFYCWTGAGSTDDEDDPENRRIVRLREVLGVEGMAVPEIVPNRPLLPPPAPRLES